MICHCAKTAGLEWIRLVIVVLACSGLRISELVGLRWSDVDLPGSTIVLTDERASRRRREMGNARRVKGKRTRRIPISTQLHDLLRTLPRHADGRLLHDQVDRPLLVRRVRAALISDVIEPGRNSFRRQPARSALSTAGCIHFGTFLSANASVRGQQRARSCRGRDIGIRNSWHCIATCGRTTGSRMSKIQFFVEPEAKPTESVNTWTAVPSGRSEE